MNSLELPLIRTTTLIITLLHLLSQITCFTQTQPPDTARGSLFEGGKTRLGSTPPSCHNKCNQCHPCFAVQVPTLPSHDRFQPGLTRVATTEFFDSPSFPNKYSNYKPLGWKCRCSDHFFNP